jgi:hypothetical protein
MHDHIESAREMLEAIATPVSNKPLSYWSLRLCDALEASVIDAELVQRCIEAIREYS